MSRRYAVLITLAAIAAVAGGAIFLITPPVSRVASPRAIGASPAPDQPIRNGTKSGAATQVGTSEQQPWSSIPRGFDRNQRIEREAYGLGIRDMSAAWRQLETITDATGATVSTKGMELSEFIGKVRGREGTQVTVFVQAPDATTSQPIILMRQQIIHKTAAK